MRLLLLLALASCTPDPVLSWTCADLVAARGAFDRCADEGMGRDVCRKDARSIHCTATCIANCGTR